jgi:hypothetical protein
MAVIPIAASLRRIRPPRRFRPGFSPLEARALLAVLFQPAQTYSSGGINPGVSLAGDFDGDGSLDLVALNAVSNTAGLLLNRGDGTFGAATPFPINGNDPFLPVAGDFDRDGDLDLAVPNLFTANLSVFLNHGDATFDPPASYPIGVNAICVAAADFDGDGVLDLAVTDNDFYNQFESGRVFILIGRGDGTFRDAVPHDAGAGAFAVVAADLDSDGSIDLAVTHEQPGRPGFVSILRGHGDGTFSAPSDFAAGSNAYVIAAADLDGDGDLDLAVANNTDPGTVSILDARGDGTFEAPRTFAVGRNPFGLAAADFDGNGSIDLVTSDDGDDTVSFLANVGDGTFQPPVAYAVGDSPYTVTVGDFDGNGRPDLATADRRSDTLSVLLNALPGRPIVRITGGGDAPEPDGELAPLRFLVTLTAPAVAPTTVHYRVVGQTAQAGLDFAAAEGDVTFAPGQTSIPIDVLLLPDSIPEAAESFRVEITGGPDISVAIGSATGRILDSDPATITVQDASAPERDSGASSLAFVVRLAHPSPLPVTVAYSTAPGTATPGADYVPASGTLTFEPGEVTKNVQVSILGDVALEADETFFLDLSSPSGGVLATSRGVGTIANDDQAGTIRFGVVPPSVSEGATQVLVTLVREGGTSGPLVARLHTSGTAMAGVDYTAPPQLVSFDPGETTVVVAIPIADDAQDEPDESIFLLLTDSDGAVLGTKSITLLDDDPPQQPPAPQLVALARLGVHAQPTRVVLVFDSNLDSSRARDLANYQLTGAGPDGRLGTRDDRPIRLRASSYDAASRTVTLKPLRRLSSRNTYALLVSGTAPGGLASLSGQLLDGDRDGRPGGDAKATLRGSAASLDISPTRSALPAGPRGASFSSRAAPRLADA